MNKVFKKDYLGLTSSEWLAFFCLSMASGIIGLSIGWLCSLVSLPK